MAQYAIVAFPDLQQRANIEAVRRRLDPMAEVLHAHVTIVFPFSASLSTADIEEHIRHGIDDVGAFDFELGEPSPGDGGYVFLNVLRGAAPFLELHDRLYAGILSPYRSRVHEYVPHLTIGRLSDSHAAIQAAREAGAQVPAGLRGTVRSLALFRLDDPRTGHVEATFPLEPRRRA